MENHIEKMPEQFEAEPKQAPVKSKKIKITVSKKTLVIAAVIIAIAAVGALAFYLKGLFIAGIVNGSPIYRLTVISEMEKASGKKTLESLITKKLIDDEARAKGVVITPADIDAELKIVEDQIKAQGGTLNQVLAEQGITLDYLKKQITVQKELENLLADQIKVSGADITKFIADNKITIPAGQDASFKEKIKNQLKQQKLTDAAGAFLDSLRSKSKINYFVNY